MSLIDNVIIIYYIYRVNLIDVSHTRNVKNGAKRPKPQTNYDFN